MITILIISPNNTDAPAFYRSIGPFTALEKGGDIRIVDGANMDINWASLSRFDIVFMSRPCRYEDASIANLVNEIGIPLWVDYDDNVLEVNEDNPGSLFYSMPQIRQVVTEVLSRADVLTVSTEELAVVYSSLCNNIKVLPNALNTDVCSVRPKQTTNTIMYRGSNTHNVDLYEVTDELIDLIDGTHGWNWLFMGFHPWWIQYEAVKKMTHWPSENKDGLYWKSYVDIMYYFNILKEVAPRIFIVPLADTPFNKGKSNIGFLEATYAGAVTIAPKYLPEFNKPGVQLYETPEEFGTILKSCITKKLDMKKANDESWEYVNDELTLDIVNKKRIDIIESL